MDAKHSTLCNNGSNRDGIAYNYRYLYGNRYECQWMLEHCNKDCQRQYYTKHYCGLQRNCLQGYIGYLDSQWWNNLYMVTEYCAIGNNRSERDSNTYNNCYLHSNGHNRRMQQHSYSNSISESATNHKRGRNGNHLPILVNNIDSNGW
jgi:hypothetical protein